MFSGGIKNGALSKNGLIILQSLQVLSSFYQKNKKEKIYSNTSQDSGHNFKKCRDYNKVCLFLKPKNVRLTINF